MKSNFVTQLMAILVLCLLSLFISVQFSYSQYSNLAYWNFDGMPTSVMNANTGSGTLYMNGTNGSSSGWNLTNFSGTSGNAIAFVGDGNNGKHMVFKFSTTGRQNTRVTFQTRGTSTGYTSGNWAYSEDGVTWTAIPGNTATTSTSFSQKTFTTAGLNNKTNAYLRYTLSGCSSANGNNRVDEFYIATEPAAILPCPSPIVSVQPASVNTLLPNSATFEVTASNTTSYQWQWRANASAIWANVSATQGTGGNTNTFTTVATTAAMNEYQYRVVLTNACATGTATVLNSDSAILNLICPNPTINTQVIDENIVLGDMGIFAVVANEVTAYQWQWRNNANASWINVTAAEGTGGNTDTFTTIPSEIGMNGNQYRVVLSNSCGATTVVGVSTSDSGILNITCPAIEIVDQPLDTQVVLGATALFTVNANNGTNYQWQWRANANAQWTNVTANEGTGGTTDSFITVATTANMQGYQYRVLIENNCGANAVNVFSDTATLSICMPPMITLQAINDTVIVGNAGIFKVNANNTSAYQWQWRPNATASWTNVSLADGTGGDTDSFTTIASSLTMTGYEYRVILTNACGINSVVSINTDSVKLVVVCPPAPLINSPLVDVIVNVGTHALFTVDAVNAIAYQWQIWDDVNLTWNNIATNAIGYSGQQSDSLNISTPGLQLDSTKYRVLIMNICNDTTISNDAYLIIESGITVQTNVATLLSEQGFTSLTTFTNTGIGQSISQGIRYSTDGTNWSPLILAGIVNNLQPNTQYYYQAFVTFDIGIFYGDIKDTFTLAKVPGASSLTALNGGTSIQINVGANNNPHYTEYAISSGNNWVQANGTLGNTEHWQSIADWNATIINGLSPLTNYCFVAKARNNDGIVTASNSPNCVQTKDSGSVSINNKNQIQNKINIYPNPSNTGYINIDFENENLKSLAFTIVDIKGQKWDVNKSQKINSKTIQIDCSNLHDGHYFLNIYLDGVLQTKQFVIAR